MPSKAVFQFQLAQYYWSESWEHTSSGQEAATQFLKIQTLRQVMLAPPAQLTKIYVRQFAVYGIDPNPLPGVVGTNSSVLVHSAPYSSEGGAPGAGKGSDIASNAVRVTAFSGGNIRRNVWFRGFNDITITYNLANQARIQELFKQQVVKLIDAASAASLGWYGLIRGGINAPVALTAVGVDGPGRVTITAAAGGTWTANTQIHVGGATGRNLYQKVPGRGGINGNHWVYAVNGNVLTLDLFAATLPGPPVLVSGGKISNRRQKFYPVDPAGLLPQDLWVAEKRPAKAMGQARGRRRVTFRNSN